MAALRVLLCLGWFGSLLVWSIQANHCFTQWAYRFGVAVSMGLALLSGWAAFWVGCRLVSNQHRQGAGFAVGLILVPLLVLLGSIGVSEMWSSQADPDYYRLNGVGPVNFVAYLAQAAGMLLGLSLDWRHAKRARALAWVDSPEQD